MVAACVKPSSPDKYGGILTNFGKAFTQPSRKTFSQLGQTIFHLFPIEKDLVEKFKLCG